MQIYRNNNRIGFHATLQATYPVIERNGALLAWYHPDGAEPSWDVPELEEFGGGAAYSEVFRRHYSLNCHWQEVSETQVDAAHIQAHLIDYQIAMNGGVRPERPPRSRHW